MLVLLSILACLTPQDIADNYYGEQSFRIASADSVCGEGYGRQLGLNRIARANYKHENYKRALRFARRVDAEHDKLYWDTRSLLALLHQNLGHFGQADSLYQEVLSAGLTYRDILYEAHLNRAELMRLQLNYEAREYNLLQALSYGEGWQRRKAIRVLARHYFKVMQDFGAAREMIAQHGEPETDEGRAGYLLLMAEFHEAQESYERAQDFYIKAIEQSRAAGFIAFQHNASDGYMRSQIKNEQVDTYRVALVALLCAIALGYLLYSTKGV